ncbi:MAG: hypothetical protein RIA64_06630 [Rhodospirillales bacterium]
MDILRLRSPEIPAKSQNTHNVRIKESPEIRRLTWQKEDVMPLPPIPETGIKEMKILHTFGRGPRRLKRMALALWWAGW